MRGYLVGRPAKGGSCDKKMRSVRRGLEAHAPVELEAPGDGVLDEIVAGAGDCAGPWTVWP